MKLPARISRYRRRQPKVLTPAKHIEHDPVGVAEAFEAADAIMALVEEFDGFKPSEDDLALRRRVIGGELTCEQATQITIARVKARYGARAELE